MIYLSLFTADFIRKALKFPHTRKPLSHGQTGIIGQLIIAQIIPLKRVGNASVRSTVVPPTGPRKRHSVEGRCTRMRLSYPLFGRSWQTGSSFTEDSTWVKKVTTKWS
jgi:hypothetical protein